MSAKSKNSKWFSVWSSGYINKPNLYRTFWLGNPLKSHYVYQKQAVAGILADLKPTITRIGRVAGCRMGSGQNLAPEAPYSARSGQPMGVAIPLRRKCPRRALWGTVGVLPTLPSGKNCLKGRVPRVSSSRLHTAIFRMTETG